MATILKSIAQNGLSEEVASGDTLVIRSRHLAGERGISLSVYPKAGSASVKISHTKLDLIVSNPDDPSITWTSWPNGDVTTSSGNNEDTLVGAVKAIQIKAIGGACQVDASYDQLAISTRQ